MRRSGWTLHRSTIGGITPFWLCTERGSDFQQAFRHCYCMKQIQLTRAARFEHAHPLRCRMHCCCSGTAFLGVNATFLCGCESQSAISPVTLRAHPATAFAWLALTSTQGECLHCECLGSCSAGFSTSTDTCPTVRRCYRQSARD